MRHIEIAESFAQAARQAAERGEHRQAAKLFAEAMKALRRGPGNVLAHVAEGARWTVGRWMHGLDGAERSDVDGPPPSSRVRR
jgi:hypothetical protein